MRAAECARAGAESKLVVPVLLDLGLRVVAVVLPLVVAARAALAVAARAVGLGDAALVAPVSYTHLTLPTILLV